jgi:cysteine desulfurase
LKKELPVYLDSASTSKVDSRVLEVMLPYFSEYFGNASSNHKYGKTAKTAIEKSREQVSAIINCNPKEVIFTSGATEAINLALKGYSEAHLDEGNHIITVKTEHKAVLATCEYLETKGYEITYLDVDKNGLISLDELRNAIQKNTILIAIMYVNNETGVLQPIKEIGTIARDHNITFFCDATQAVGKVKVDVEEDCIDMLCFSGHKLNGPKGIGVLYKRQDIELTPLIHGGGQEAGLRGGTYNTPLIVGLGKACELAFNEFESNIKSMLEKRTALEQYYEQSNIGVVNFKAVKRAPHIVSLTLNNFEGEEYLMLKAKEFTASTGSACNSEVVEVSHVLKAIKKENSDNIIRLSI